jgi:glutamyl/glutaminyl-tRNA synthetase
LSIAERIENWVTLIPVVPAPSYCGRLAPSPTGFLHLGHARTFWIAAERAREARGRLLLRNDDLDRERCRPEYVAAFQEDLAWLGLGWDGPMISQLDRLPRHRAAAERLLAGGLIYPCYCSRRDVLAAARAPHEAEEQDEPLYPGTCRLENRASDEISAAPTLAAGSGVNWRFRVPDGAEVAFVDGAAGPQRAIAGRDFGDFIVWRKEGVPSYQLACAVDDAELGVTEVVRGADLIPSTFRQILLHQALGHPVPAFYHCSLVRDAAGRRLAKRQDDLSLRALRAAGVSPAQVIARFGPPP